MKPSDHLKAGECGMCHATGTISVLVPPPEHEEVCPACYGSGKFPPVDEQGTEIPAGQ